MIDVSVFHHKESETTVAFLRAARQSMSNGIDVLRHFGVFEDLFRVAQTPHDHHAKAILVVERDGCFGRAADIRQIVGANRPHRCTNDTGQGSGPKCV
jgi:hypothetical protein